MRPLLRGLAVGAAVSAFAAAFAQDAPMQGHDMASASELPAACQAAEAPAMPGMEGMPSAMEPMDEHHREMMQSMMTMQDAMMRGMMAEDPDVSFACAMIPHHQSAIAMAEAELRHGDAEPMRAMAQEIIDAQQREIAELTEWLEGQGE